MGSSPSHHTAIHCDVCQSQNKASPAVSYCKDCDETLCKNCDNVHRNSKQSTNHTILTGDQFKQVKRKSRLQNTDSTYTGADAVPGRVYDSTNNALNTVIKTADAVHGRLKDTKSDDNSVPGRTKDTSSDSYNAVGGVNVATDNTDSVPGRIKDTQITAGVVSGRVVDKNNDQVSVPGRKLDSSSVTDTVPSVLDLTVSDIRYHNVGCRQIQSVVFMPSGHVVLARGYDGLILLDKHFKPLSKLNVCAVSACKFSDIEVLVSLGQGKVILFVTVLPNKGVRHVLNIGKVSTGVCQHNGEIYVACSDRPGNGEIRVVDRYGKLIRRMGYNDGTYMFTEPLDVKVNNVGDKVFVVDSYDHSLTCLDMTDTVVFTYKDTELKVPVGILVDRQYNILVTAAHSHNVHVINKAGIKHKFVLTEKDGLWSPFCISYRQDDGILAIGMGGGGRTKTFVTMNTSLSSDV